MTYDTHQSLFPWKLIASSWFIFNAVLEEEPARRTQLRTCEAARSVLFHPRIVQRGVPTASQGHNFFEPQPAQDKDVTVFLLCKILHDWSDEYCIKILKHLRAAAGPKTQLVVSELHIACACDDPATHEIPGADLHVPPHPLLPNMGRAGSLPHTFDANASESVAELNVCADSPARHRC